MSQSGTINPELSCYISFIEKRLLQTSQVLYQKSCLFQTALLLVLPQPGHNIICNLNLFFHKFKFLSTLVEGNGFLILAEGHGNLRHFKTKSIVSGIFQRECLLTGSLCI